MASKVSLFAVAHAGKRLVAAGIRGTIVYSDSSGKEWRQATVPVTSDLTGLAFPTERSGWAVGHGAVVLHSNDGGATWVKQLDGRNAGTLAQKYYETAAGNLGDRTTAILEQARRLGEEKETQPFLKVWFKNEKTGFVAGTFNRLFRTDDGGAHWIPMIDKTDNPKELHFYAVCGLGDEVYLAGEQGVVWRWDESKGRFIAVPTPYNGSLFGLLVTPRVVLAFGMRGSLFRTLDRGVHWEQVPTGVTSGIVTGDIRANGDIVLASYSGELLLSTDEGATFQPLALSGRIGIASMASAPDGALVLAGPIGIRTETPKTPAKP